MGKILTLFTGLAFAGTMHASASDDLQVGRLVVAIDCVDDVAAGKYFECGKVKVVDSPIGKYRETEPVPDSRFGFCFRLEKIGVPYLVVTTYPDDKSRCMSISDGSCYDLSNGVFTGAARPHDGLESGLAQPLSGKMVEARQIFWPRWNDCSIVFTNTTPNEPSAAVSVKIYEINALPPLVTKPFESSAPHRTFGLAYEDPCGMAADNGALTFDQWLNRVVVYAKHAGMDRLTYPLAWYHGPLYPSAVEPASYFDWDVASPVNRNLYIRWTTKPADWPEQLLSRLDREGLEFVAQVTFIRLGSLMAQMNTDMDAIVNGADTINNMRSDNQVQCGTSDWTGQYNVRNFDRQAAGEPWKEIIPFEEKFENSKVSGPMFNPLHPIVEAAYLRSIREIVERYGKHPSFKGIHIYMYGSSSLSFGSLQRGYDDTTIRLFEAETGIKIPVDGKRADRFSERYAFLTSTDELRNRWIEWRCRKITGLFRKMSDEVAKVPGAKLALSLSAGREAGYDAEALKKEPNILVTGGFSSVWPFVIGGAGEETIPNVHIFDTWIERWGKFRWYACEPGDPEAKKLATIFGEPAEGICRMGSEFEKDGFPWPQAEYRVNPAFSGGVHYMRSYANAVSRFDPLSLSRGGLTLDRGHSDMQRPFGKAFRALPAKKFATVGSSIDPVTVRTAIDGQYRYVYAVNLEYYPSKVTVNLADVRGDIHDFVTDNDIPAQNEWQLTLGPYELRSFAMPSSVQVKGFTAVQPPEIVADLIRRGQLLEQKICESGEKLTDGETAIPGQLREALAGKQWARLRSLLESRLACRILRADADKAAVKP